jgi:tetratricopeptide (TPR) repeat protein
MNKEKGRMLYEKAKKLLEKGNISSAKAKFYKALKYDDNVWIRNNLALTLFMSDDLTGALSVLEPILAGGKGNLAPNPFTFALASIVHSTAGNELQARRFLKQAIEKFDLEILKHEPTRMPFSLREYTIIIIKAAANLKDYKLVNELYLRWKHLHVSWETAYISATACFNMGKYREAAKLLETIEEISPAFVSMKRIIQMIEQGEIPPFELDHKLIPKKELNEKFRRAAKNEETRREILQEGYFRMILLDSMLSEEDPEAAAGILSQIIKYGGKWGEELANKVLNSAYYSKQLKFAAARALVEIGIYKKDEPVPALIDGEKTFIKTMDIEFISSQDKNLDKTVEEALKLRDKGRLDEAINLLEDLIKKGQFYPPAVLNLANFLRSKGDFEKALELFEMLEQVANDNPVFLFNYSALMLEIGDTQRAWEYFKRIDRNHGMGKDFDHKLKLLESQIELSSTPPVQDVIESWMESMREDIEEKTIPIDPSVLRGLKNMPAHWLDGACQIYGLEPARHRKDREKQLYDFLTDHKNFEKIINLLSEEEKELLSYLIQHDGWSRLNAVTQRFGSMDGDGFYWAEQPPESPLGNLWAKALVAVGRAKIKSRTYKIVTIPVELRQLLS